MFGTGIEAWCCRLDAAGSVLPAWCCRLAVCGGLGMLKPHAELAVPSGIFPRFSKALCLWWPGSFAGADCSLVAAASRWSLGWSVQDRATYLTNHAPGTVSGLCLHSATLARICACSSCCSSATFFATESPWIYQCPVQPLRSLHPCEVICTFEVANVRVAQFLVVLLLHL